MNHYQNAEETFSGARSLFEAGNFRLSITLSCLAIELFLKSKLELIEHDVHLETSHDIISIYKSLTTRFTGSQELASKITIARKYYNDSRYPAIGTEIYTSKFAEEFLGYVKDVKSYIDLDCTANIKADIERAVDTLLGKFFTNINKIVLFGSYATGKYQTDSDIDLAIALNELPDIKQRRFYKQAVDIDRDIDLLFCSKEQLENNEFVYRRIKEQGVVLYEQL